MDTGMCFYVSLLITSYKFAYIYIGQYKSYG